MMPHSGVIAYDFLDRPFPVVGWYSYRTEDNGLVVQPLVLERGTLVPLHDAKVKFSLVGNMSELWINLVGDHSPG